MDSRAVRGDDKTVHAGGELCLVLRIVEEVGLAGLGREGVKGRQVLVVVVER